MNLIPLSDRVLIVPDVAPTVTESGIELVQHWVVEQTGTVVATGCARHPLKDVAFDLAQMVEKIASGMWRGGGYSYSAAESVKDAAQMLRDLTGREPELKVGDKVIFSPYVGQEVRIDGTRYVVMREADVLAVMD